MELKDYLKEARIKCGLTQEQASEKIEASINTIQNWEYGKSFPERSLWKNIINVYNLDEVKFKKLYVGLEDSYIEENIEINYQNKLISTKENIEESIKSFDGTFLEMENIVNNILELIKLYDSFYNNQYSRCKNILKKAIYVLFKFKGNKFTLKDLYILIVNTFNEGRMIVNKFMKLPAQTEEEQQKNLEIALFFLETFFEKDFKNKKEKNIYSQDVILLSYYLNELIDVKRKEFVEMGCSHDKLSINLKTKEMAKKTIKIFKELLKEYLYCDFFDVEIDIKENEDGFWIYIDEMPLFNCVGGEEIDYFVKEFIKIYPNEYFYLTNTTSSSSCGDTTYNEFKYDEQNKELTIKRVYSEWGDGLYDCPECEENFDGEALVCIEDYEEGNTYICPNCGGEITFDAKQYIEKIKFEDF